MQEEVTQKTVTFCIRATKITADLLKKVLVVYLRHQNLYAIKEKCQHGSIQVPYSYYDCGIPDYFTSVPLHWHSEMELNYIKSGNVFFKYEDQTISAKPGDIVLIQPNVLHAIMSDEHSSFFYDTIVFHQNMLVGSYDDRCYTDILLPIFSSRRRVLVPVSQDPPPGIMNSMIRSGLLCSVRTKILQRLICY